MGQASGPLGAMGADGESMGLVAQPLQKIKNRIAAIQGKRRPIGKIQALASGVAIGALGDAGDGHVVDAQFLEDLAGGTELAGAAVDEDQIGPLAALAVGVFLEGARKAPVQHLAHHGVIVAGGDAADGELAVPVLDQPLGAGDDHRPDRARSGDMAVVVHLDAFRRPLQVQRPRQPLEQAPLRRTFRQAPAEGLGGVGLGVGHRLPLFAPLRRRHPHRASGVHRERGGDEGLVLQGMADQYPPGHRLVGVELPEEGLQHRRRAFVAGMAGKIGAVAVVAPGAKEENLDAGLSAGLMGGDDVGLPGVAQVDVLVRLDAGEGADAVAVKGRLLEFEGVAGRLHGGRQMTLDGLAVALEEGLGLAHQGAIFVGVDAFRAGRAAALDLMQKTRPRPIGEHGVGTRPQQKYPLQHGEGLIDRPGRSERAEIIALAAAPAAVLEHPRKSVVAGDQNHRKRLVVAQEDIVAGRVSLDQIGFQQERFGLGVGGEELHRSRACHHAANSIGKPGQSGVAHHPFFQVLRLAHVEDVAAGVDHAIDTGDIGQSLEVGLDHGDARGRRPVVARRRRQVRMGRNAGFRDHKSYVVESEAAVNRDGKFRTASETIPQCFIRVTTIHQICG